MAFTKRAVLWTVGILGVAIVAVGLVAYAIATDDDRDTASIIRVVDGDTVDVELNGEETRVRLLNVDTPETKHPDEPVQCLGLEASQFLEDLLPVGTEVELEYDVEEEDRYDRTLAGMFHDEALVNAQIAAEGLGVAIVYEPNRKFYDPVKEAEEIARDKQIGLFDPDVECALPQQLAVMQDQIDQLDEDLPADVGGVEQELDELVPIQVQVAEYHDLVASLRREGARDLEEKSFLVVLYKEQLKAFEEQLETNKGSLEERESKLMTHKEALEIEAERQAEAERQRAEEEREAEEDRQRQEEAAAEQQRQQEAEEQRRQQAEAAEEDRTRSQQREQSSGSSGGSGSSGRTAPRPRPSDSSNSGAPAGYGVDSDYPGYTGPRCYAPGGRYWKPC